MIDIMQQDGHNAGVIPPAKWIPRLRSWLVPGVAALILAYVFVLTGEAVHLTLVRHSTCEHGEFIHAGGHRTPADSEWAPRDSVISGDAHAEHCGLAATRRREFSAATPAFIENAVPSGRVTLTVGRPVSAPESKIPVYQMAPKTSPPLAG